MCAYKLATITPFGKENGHISDFVMNLVTDINCSSEHFFVINDFTDKKTVEAIKTSECLAHINIVRTTGYSLADAYIAGYKAILDSKADHEFVLEIDCGSYDTKVIDRMVEKVDRMCGDFIYSSRFCDSGSFSGSIMRMIVSRVGTHLMNRISPHKLSDYTGGMYITRKSILEILLLNFISHGHFFQCEYKYKIAHATKNITDHPIHYKTDVSSFSSNSVLDAFACYIVLLVRRLSFGKL